MGGFDRLAKSFERALDEVRAAPRAALSETERAGSGATVFSAGFDLSRPRVEGGAARWSLATDWTDEPRGPDAPGLACDLHEPETADLAAAVVQELGFCPGMTRATLTERWRAFMWRNHPDRQAPHARLRADARVAIANALYDRAMQIEM